MVQLLDNTFPGALWLRNNYGRLPIHELCCNKDLDNSASIDIIRFMLGIDPALPREIDDNGRLPIHYAVAYKSTIFCKELIDAYPESLRIYRSDNMLPIHVVCPLDEGYREDTADTSSVNESDIPF